MSKPKRYDATHKFEGDVENLRIPNVTTISVGAEIVELSPSGVKVEAGSLDRLSFLSNAAKIATIYASGYRHLLLPMVNLREDGKDYPHSGVIILEAGKLETELNREVYQSTMRTLLGIDSDSLVFLIRAFELQGTMNELAILNAMFGLDLQLSRNVPQFWNWSARIALLEFLQVVSSDSIKRLRQLGRLRDILAHGDWTNESVGDRLNDLLEKGRDTWILKPRRISTEATRLVIGRILLAFDDLTRSRKPLEALIQEISKPSVKSVNPTKVDTDKHQGKPTAT